MKWVKLAAIRGKTQESAIMAQIRATGAALPCPELENGMRFKAMVAREH